MTISAEKIKALHEEMEKHQVFEKDILESFISGSGSGGQKINKTQNCVYLKHVPTKIEVKCQKDRSREANRFFARRELLEKIKEKILAIPSKKSLKEEKIRKQKKRRARRSLKEESEEFQ
jgi:protein subunit release factor B